MKQVLAVSILLLTLSFGTASRTQAQFPAPRFEPSECQIEVPSEPSIECGTLITPEDYNDPEGKEIRTAVIIIHSRNANPSKEAMLFTEGGPGFSSLQFVWWLASTEFANERDIVILEQRGNKYSEPSLACDFSVWWNETEGQTPCLDSLLEDGIALEHYTSASIAADINALKQALDYESWILYGTSYSTRPIQLVMARYPENIRGVVLHSTSPVTDTRYQHDTEHAARVLQVLFNDCTADPNCAEAYPELESHFQELIQKLNDDLVELDMVFPGSTERFILEVNGDTLISWMVEGAFYGPAYPPFETAYLPLLIDGLWRGNTELLYPWAKEHIADWGDDAFAWGQYFAVNCQDDAASVNPEMIETQLEVYPELDGYFRHREELAICAAWGLNPAPPLAAEPVSSDIPTLILAGTYDPITPPEWSQTALVNLSNSTFVEFPSSGHSVVRNNPCAEQITTAFLDAPDQKPDLSCVEAAPKPKFVLPNEMIIAPDIYEIHYGEIGYSLIEERLFLVSWLTLIGSGAIALIAGAVQLARRREPAQQSTLTRYTLLLLVLFGATALVWGYALRNTLRSVARTAATALRFGLPAGYWWIFAAAILMGLMTILLIAITALAWKRSYWSMTGRIALSLTTLAAVTISGMLAYWNLFMALFR